MKVLVTGASGYVGSAIAASLGQTHDVVGIHHVYAYPNLISLDITSPEQVRDVISRVQPEMIVHCAALVDGCEEDPVRAQRINVEGTRNILDAACTSNARVVFLSTAAVFDAKDGIFSEADEVASQTVYGRTKIEAEQLVLESDLPSLILRPALIVGMAPYGMKGRFFGKIVHATESNALLAVDNSWRLTPTWNRHLADVIAHWTDGTMDAPILHVACPEAVTKYALARTLARELGGDDTRITPTTSLERLPSILNVERLKDLGFPHPSLGEMTHGIALEVEEQRRVQHEALGGGRASEERK